MNRFLENSVIALVEGIQNEAIVTQDEAEDIAALMIKVGLFSESAGFNPGIKGIHIQQVVNAMRRDYRVFTALNQMPLKTNDQSNKGINN